MNQTDCWSVFPSFDTAHGSILMTIFICIMACNLIANTLMMIGLWKTKRRFSRPQKLYFSLCISDILVGVLNVPLNITTMIKQNISCTVLAVQLFIGSFAIHLGMLIMLSIVIDRYLLITKTRFYNVHIEYQSIVIFLAVTTVIAFASGIPYVLISLSSQKQMGIILFSTATGTLLIIICMTTLNYLLIKHVTKTEKETSRNTGVQAKYTRRTTKIVIILSMIMIVCYLPAAICRLFQGIYAYREESETVLTYFTLWTYPLVLFNTTINSVVYIRRTIAINDYYKNSIKQFHQTRRNMMNAPTKAITFNTTTV